MKKLKPLELITWHRLFVFASIAGLACSIAAWPETFLFGKVFHLPDFASNFPWPALFTSAYVLLFLVGPALTASNVWRGLLSSLAVLVVASMIGVPLHEGKYGVSNYVFNVGWIAIFHGLIPLTSAVLLSLIVTRFRRYRPAQT